MHKCFDAAFPPLEAPAGCDSVLGYIGGSRALHTWALDEWRRFSHLRQFPCWVPDPHGRSTPAQIGQAITARANELGWRSSGGSRVVVVDLETFASAKWWHELATAVNEGGYYAVCYGSAATVRANEASNYWAALYDGEATVPGWAHAKQYEANVRVQSTEVDYSVISDWMFERGGVGPRH